eukprot:1142011-Pelagomonas_calceolata.AAC.5
MSTDKVGVSTDKVGVSTDKVGFAARMNCQRTCGGDVEELGAVGLAAAKGEVGARGGQRRVPRKHINPKDEGATDPAGTCGIAT